MLGRPRRKAPSPGTRARERSLVGFATILALGALQMSPIARGAAPAGVPVHDRTLGVYVDDPGTIPALESAVGRRFDIVSTFYAFGDDFPTSQAQTWAAQGRSTLIAWEPWSFSLPAIAAGSEDSYIKRWAAEIKKVPGTVYIRPFHEMNSDWYPWAGSPSAFKAAWKHLVGVFKATGVTNVQWVFCANADDVPASNTLERYYPGDDYVDVLAMDGYNWGGERDDWSTWRSHTEIFTNGYNRLAALSATDPIWVTETSSTELPSSDAGNSKGSWMSSFLRETGFPRLAAVVFFSTNKEGDWRLDSSAGSLSGWAGLPSSTTGPPPSTSPGDLGERRKRGRRGPRS